MSPRQDGVLHKSEATASTPYLVIHGAATLHFNHKSGKFMAAVGIPPPLETHEADQGALCAGQYEG